MSEDAPGMGTSTAVPALPLPAPPDRAAQPGASSVGRTVEHTPAPGQPPTTRQSLSSGSPTQGTRGRGTLTAPSHCCCGWAGSGSPPGIPGEEGDISAPRSLPGSPCNEGEARLYAASSSSSLTQLCAQRDGLTPCCHGGRGALAPTRARQEPGLQLGHPGCGGSRRARWPCVLS